MSACCASRTFKCQPLHKHCNRVVGDTIRAVCSSTSCLHVISSGRREGKKDRLFANLHVTCHLLSGLNAIVMTIGINKFVHMLSFNLRFGYVVNPLLLF